MLFGIISETCPKVMLSCLQISSKWSRTEPAGHPVGGSCGGRQVRSADEIDCHSDSFGGKTLLLHHTIRGCGCCQDAVSTAQRSAADNSSTLRIRSTATLCNTCSYPVVQRIVSESNLLQGPSPQ